MSDEVKHAQVLELMRTKQLAAYKAYQQVYGCTEASAKSNAYKIFGMENNGMKQALIDVGLDMHTLAENLKEAIDNKHTRGKGLDLAFKITGVFSPEKQEVTVTGLKSVLDDLEK